MLPKQSKMNSQKLWSKKSLNTSSENGVKGKNLIILMGKKCLSLKEFFVSRYKKISPRLRSGILISALLLVLVYGTYLWNLTPAKIGAKDYHLVQIPYGASLHQVGQILKQGGFIRNKLVYEIYVRLNPKRRMAEAGSYRISPGMTVPRIVRELRRGTPLAAKITIPEGLTIREIADLLAKNGLVNRERFLEQAKDLHFANEILGDYLITNSLEGYLFPDTYNFEYTGTPERDIIRKMLRRFKEVFTANFGPIAPAKRREMVIMASVVEKEAKKAQERPIIAGVFNNRLRLGYPLQSCATVQFALGRWKKRLYYKDLEVNSPYNTYRHNGLPPGPIANPGLASLKAAASPAKVNYFYFVAKADGTHVFSKTYQEHLNAQHKIERENPLLKMVN